jgi:SAM-dependent methyltransferase
MRCPSCGFAWVPDGVMRTGSGVSIYEDATRALFEDFADYYRDASANEAARTKLDWVTRFASGGRLLDVGANYGHFVRSATGRFDAIGIDPSPQAVAWARAHIPAPIQQASIEDDREEFAGRFNAITMFDVIEHLENPRAALQQCRRYLAADGHLFITTPDAGSVVARLLGRSWYHYDLEQHISLFSVSNLQLLLEQCGFTVMERRTFGRRYRFSYIDRRLRDLARESALFRAAHLMAFPLRLFPEWHILLHPHDVTGLVVRLQSPP